MKKNPDIWYKFTKAEANYLRAAGQIKFRIVFVDLLYGDVHKSHVYNSWEEARERLLRMKPAEQACIEYVF